MSVIACDSKLIDVCNNAWKDIDDALQNPDEKSKQETKESMACMMMNAAVMNAACMD